MANSYWLSGYNIEEPAVANFRYQPPKPAGTTQTPPPIEASIIYNPSSTWEALYDDDGRTVFRTESKGGVWGPVRTTSSYDYAQTSTYERVVQTTTTFAPKQEIAIACGFPDEVVPPLPGNITAIAKGEVEVSKTKTITTATKRSVITQEYKTVPSILTAEGAAAVQQIIESYRKQYKKTADLAANLPIPLILEYALRNVSLPVSVRYAQKAPETSISTAFSNDDTSDPSVDPLGVTDISLENLTDEELQDLITSELDGLSLSDLLDLKFADNRTDSIDREPDPDAGWNRDELKVPEISFDESDFNFSELTPPFVPDDTFIAVGDKYEVVDSQAVEKAQQFAKLQNKSKFGRRNGQSIVHPIEYWHPQPFSPIYLEFNGKVAQYRTDSTRIAFDSTGILVSTDGIFWGGVGQ